MPKPGDVLIEADGGRVVFRQTAATTNGELLEIEAYYPSHSELPMAHYHPNQEEHFQVVRGEMRVILEGEENNYQAGEEFVVPVGAHHAMQNVSDEEAKLIWRLADYDKVNEQGMPSLLQMAVIAREYRREFRLASPPYPVQWILFGLLAPIGRLKGYKGSYSPKNKGPEQSLVSE
jgi:quercetin dioxygenase-like cupin family protein